jgi:hypothetical protein
MMMQLFELQFNLNIYSLLASAFIVGGFILVLIKLKRRYITLLSLNLIACVALLGLILKPSQLVNQKLNIGLITPSQAVNTKQIINKVNASVLDAIYVIETDDMSKSSFQGHNIEEASKKLESDFTKINSLDEITENVKNIAHIEVFGDGLLQQQWQQIDDLKIIHHLPNKTTGFFNVSWDKRVENDQSLEVKVQLQLSNTSEYSDSKLSINLVDPAGEIVDSQIVDSQMIENQMVNNQEKYDADDRVFKLSSWPKIIGHHQYKIQLLASPDNDKPIAAQKTAKLLASENINLEVVPPHTIKIMVVQSSPSFEIKQLQNWAADDGNTAIINYTKISKNKYSKRLINWQNKNSPSNQESLENFDLLIADSKILDELLTDNNSQTPKLQISSQKNSPALNQNRIRELLKVEALEQAIKNGLGVIILADDELVAESHLKSSFLSQGLITEKTLAAQIRTRTGTRNKNSENTRLVLFNDLSLPNNTRQVDRRIEFSQKQNLDVKPLVTSTDGRIVVSQKSLGLGRVSISQISDSYQWVTQGDALNHSRLWQYLINQTARIQSVNIRQLKNRNLIFHGQLSQLCFYSAEAIKTLRVQHASSTERVAQEVLMQKNPSNPQQQCGYFWPSEAGWQQIAITTLGNTSEHSLSRTLWVEPSNHWQAYQQQIKWQDTQHKARSYQLQNQYLFSSTANQEPNESSLYYKAINPWYFWWVFILSTSLLWFERKRA